MTCVTPYARVKDRCERAEPVHVGPELTSAPRAVACPSCGAALRYDAQWCSLCYHDLRPAPVVLPEAIEAGLDPLTAPLMDLVLPAVPDPRSAAVVPPTPRPIGGWPCSRCGVLNDMDATLCGTCGAGFLAAVRDKPSLVVPGVGDVHALSRGQRAGLAAAVVALFLVPVALLTFLTTGSPKKAPTPTSTTPVTTTLTP